MVNKLLFAFWFFLPGGIANLVPVLVAKAPLLRNWESPVDWGKSYRGIRVLGDHKTWRGLITGVIGGLLITWLEVILYHHFSSIRIHISQTLDYSHISVISIGFTLAAGALIGDMVKSFFKRQARVSAGRSWFPFDQLDYIAGGLILSSLVVTLQQSIYFYVIVLYFCLHLLFSYLGYRLKFKDTPI